jgi:ribonuclease HIII
MKYNLIITDEANTDTINAISYYNSINSLLSARFEAEVNFTVNKVANNPFYYKYLSKGKVKKYRCTKLKSFPYLLVFKVIKNDIVIIALFNTYRKPILGIP